MDEEKREESSSTSTLKPAQTQLLQSALASPDFAKTRALRTVAFAQSRGRRGGAEHGSRSIAIRPVQVSAREPSRREKGGRKTG